MWFVTEKKGLTPKWKIRTKCECNEDRFFKTKHHFP